MNQRSVNESAQLADEARYCSFGDTVHYVDPPKIFERCEGSYLFDARGVPYLDLQMWYSAVNFGYANPRLNGAMKRQLDTLPQVASQYLHRTKIELARTIAEDALAKWDVKGRLHFNVGGSQSIEDSLKLVRNASAGKSLMFAFEGGYHGRTLGASAITSSYATGAASATSASAPISCRSRTTSATARRWTRKPTASCASSSSSACSRANTTASGTRARSSASTPRSTSRRCKAPAAT
jgi:4-aminobutyrate aminotransferase-like enzyme